MGESARLISMVVSLPGYICVMVGGGGLHRNFRKSIMRPSLGANSLWFSGRL